MNVIAALFQIIWAQKMMKIRTWTTVVFTALLLGCSFATYPLRQSGPTIRAALFSRWPLGSNLLGIKKARSAEKILLLSEFDRSEKAPREWKKPEGRHILSLVLGDYQGLPFKVSVVAYLGFTDGRLVDCVIEKQYDGL